MAGDNKTLGRFILDGIPPAPRGIPQINVTFDIDADGILHVAAQDRATGREQKITITASSGLAKHEVERMVKDAESHSAEDRARKERIEVRNNADSAIYTAEKLMREQGDKIPGDVRSEVEAKVADVKKLLDSENTDQLRQALEALQESVQKVGAAMYQQAGPTPPPPGGPDNPSAGGSGDGSSEDVIDGEFTEKVG
jgi:molecular chaperone DnaK